MKTLITALSVGAALFLGLGARAEAAFHYYVQFEGQTQGKFLGDGNAQLAKDGFMPALHLSLETASPRDPASGLPSGKRTHHPIVITKEWSRASTQIYRALVNNEKLKSVVLRFVRTNPNGEEYVFETWKLEDASVADYKAYVADGAKGEAQSLEDVSLTYRKLIITNNDTKDSVEDQW